MKISTSISKLAIYTITISLLLSSTSSKLEDYSPFVGHSGSHSDAEEAFWKKNVIRIWKKVSKNNKKNYINMDLAEKWWKDNGRENLMEWAK